MAIILVSIPGDCVKSALLDTFARGKCARVFMIATGGRSKFVQERNVVIGFCVTRALQKARSQ